MTIDKRNDILWIWIASTLILLWSSIPTWAGHRAETEELRFRGIYFDSQDYAVHIAAMEAGRHGEWAYQFRFTTEPHPPAYVRLFYIALGHISACLRLAPELTFHLARWIFGFSALFALYRLLQRIFLESFWARIAFLLAVLGSGLGWLQLILNWTPGQITPIDFWLIDDYVFFSLSLFPHFAFVTTEMCLALRLWLEFLERPAFKNVAAISLTAILVQFVNPIAFATIDAGIFGSAVFHWWRTRKIHGEDIGAFFTIAVAQIPLLVYNFLVLNNDPLWNQFTTQNQTLSPPPVYYFWGFALFWPAVLIGLVVALRTKSDALGAVLFWILSGFMLAYAPVYIQRRFLQNITIPLAILATAGLAYFFESRSFRRPILARWRISLVVLFVFLASVSSLQIGLSQIAYLQTHPEDLYYPVGLDSAIHWFRENAQYNDFVLASEQTSQILAQRAGLRAYMGHEMETLDYRNKQAQVQAFFQGELPALAKPPIKWVVYGPLERKLSSQFQPPGNFELAYNTPDLQIYRVR
jgi:hypothetical protein